MVSVTVNGLGTMLGEVDVNAIGVRSALVTEIVMFDWQLRRL